MADAGAEILATEARYRQALIDEDREALVGLLDDELVYVHLSGGVETKTSFLTVLRNTNYLSIERRDLRLRAAGDMAVLSGVMAFEADLRLVSKLVAIEIFVTQVFVRRADGWKMLVQQATSQKIEERPAPVGA
jgi:ketosteroid isomerase-like protein